MKTWTVKQMLKEKPCERYTEEVLLKLWAGREVVDWLDIEKMDISDADKMWGAWRGLKKTQIDLVLEKIVTRRTITNHALHCGVPSVEKWAVGWLSGEDRTAWEAEAARTAWEAAETAARAAGTAGAAAWAAWTVELKLQVADVLAVLKEAQDDRN